MIQCHLYAFCCHNLSYSPSFVDLLLLGEVGGHEEEGVDDENDPGDDAEGAEGQARMPVKGGLSTG